MNLVTNTGAELFKSVYGAACASLLNHMEFLVMHATGQVPSSWEYSQNEWGVVIAAPVAVTEIQKEKFGELDIDECFSKALARTHEAMSCIVESDNPVIGALEAAQGLIPVVAGRV